MHDQQRSNTRSGITPRVKQTPAEAPLHNHGGMSHHDRQLQPNDDGTPNSATTLVMCPPRYLSTKVKNNVFMKGQKINVDRAMRQYSRAINAIEALGVEVLEIPPVKGAQDQTYVANVAIAMEPYIVVANYKAPGREIEVDPAIAFFKTLGYKDIVQPPYNWEGEADLKKWKDDVYIGGYGKFSDIRAQKWIEDRTGREVICVEEISDELYHLDCSLLVVDEENFVVVKEGLSPKSLKILEGIANITMVPSEVAATGATNCVLIPEKNICLSGMFQPEDKNYRKSMEWMNATFDKFGYTCVFLDIDEADKSGADISCMVMHLNF